MENNSNNSIVNTNKFDNDYAYDYNEIDEYVINTIFDNPEEEIMFKNEEVDEDELEDR